MQPEPARVLTLRELKSLSVARFGSYPLNWAFRCPRCGDRHTGREVEEAYIALHGSTESSTWEAEFGSRCIGRLLGAVPGANYAGRGCSFAADSPDKDLWLVVDGNQGRPAWCLPLADADPNAVVLLSDTTLNVPLPGTIIVRVPDRHALWSRTGATVIIRTLRIAENCPCGELRGDRRVVTECVDGLWLQWDEWRNPCGDQDYYEDLLRAAGVLV